MKSTWGVIVLGLFLAGTTKSVFSQSLGNAGTIEGTVLDPSGAAIAKAIVKIRNAVTNYSQSTVSAADGSFRLTASESYFDPRLAGSRTSVTVEAGAADMLEVDPSDHTDADRNLIDKLPTIDPGAGLSEAITYTTGGVAADADGLTAALSSAAYPIPMRPLRSRQTSKRH